MIKQYEPSAQCQVVTIGDRPIHLSLTGDVLIMPTPTGDQAFELHSYFGPIPLKRDGTEARRAKGEFYQQYERWKSGGQWVDGNRCVMQ